MHDVKQWIPGLKNMPFDLSGFVGFTKMKISVDLVDESQIGTSTEVGVYTDNGEGIFEANSFTIQALISKKISILTLYGGIGVNNVKSKIALEGDYEVRGSLGVLEEEYTNPIALNL